MGDIADMLNEQFDDDNAGCCGYDNVMYDEDTYSYIPVRLKQVLKCRFCGASPLQWKQIGHRWIMYELNGYVHECPENPLISTLLNKLKDKNKMNTPPELKATFGTPFNNYTPPSWDEYFMKMVYSVAEKSKDPRTKIGAVLVKDDRIISTGYNGFPIGVEDLEERYNNKELKYQLVCHAEDNAILSCARSGISSRGSVLYTQGFPCNECMKSIIQGGVEEVVIHKSWPAMTSDKWVKSIKISTLMAEETDVYIRELDVPLSVTGYLDGKIWSL